jgi:Ser/Thr protein kinase RdoA (MazF antagonist)
VLCHGDYTPEHWFVDESLKITGIIDFGDMQGGPITTDFAISKMNEPQLDINPLLRGYNGINNSLFDKDVNQQLDLHTLIY